MVSCSGFKCGVTVKQCNSLNSSTVPAVLIFLFTELVFVSKVLMIVSQKYCVMFFFKTPVVTPPILLQC